MQLSANFREISRGDKKLDFRVFVMFSLGATTVFRNTLFSDQLIHPTYSPTLHLLSKLHARKSFSEQLIHPTPTLHHYAFRVYISQRLGRQLNGINHITDCLPADVHFTRLVSHLHTAHRGDDKY